MSAAETRSFHRAAMVMGQVAGQAVSAKTIQRVVGDVGGELANRRDANPKTPDALAERPETPPELAVVECDGGRIRTRQPGHGPGVHFAGEGWRETKNACLIRATHETFNDDPQPDPPRCFCDPKHVAQLAETEALSVAWFRRSIQAGCGGPVHGGRRVNRSSSCPAVSAGHIATRSRSRRAQRSKLPKCLTIANICDCPLFSNGKCILSCPGQ